MNVREADPADAPALDVIRQQAIEAGFTGTYDRDDFAELVASSDRDLPDRLGDPTWLVLVGESDVTPVCFAALETATGRIGALYTAPEHWGRGCASELLERFETRAREEGLDALRADATHNAVGFFEGRGFERQGTVSGTVERVRVVKDLRDS